MTETLSIKVKRETKLRLQAVAKERDTKPSALIREALDLVLSGNQPGTSLYDLNMDLFEESGPGGPKDLSTNPEHLEGFGL